MSWKPIERQSPVPVDSELTQLLINIAEAIRQVPKGRLVESFSRAAREVATGPRT